MSPTAGRVAERDGVELAPVVAADAEADDRAVAMGGHHRRSLARPDPHRVRPGHSGTGAVPLDVPHPEEPCDPVVGRSRPQLVRRRDLGDTAGAEDRYAVAERECLADVVRDVDDA